MFWEYMQEPSGAIHWGTETQGYSPFTTYDKEPNRFGTEVLDTRSAGFAAGMFMHLARLIKPYKPARAQELQKHAEMAFAAAGDRRPPDAQALLCRAEVPADRGRSRPPDGQGPVDQRQCVCRHLQRRAANRSPAAAGWPPSSSPTSSRRTGPPTRPWWIGSRRPSRRPPTRRSATLAANAYPVGTPANLRWWGSNTAQGQYAYPCLLQWALTKEQKYIDAASQFMDYDQGSQPHRQVLHDCGIGFNRVHNPHDRESAYTKRQGWGPRPGILVFGPGGSGRGVSVPAVRTLPRERRYIDNLGSIQWNEFTIYQSLCFPAAVYPVLAQGRQVG